MHHARSTRDRRNGLTRRAVLGRVIAAAGLPLTPRFLHALELSSPDEAQTLSDPRADVASGYRSLSPEAAAFTETLVKVLCPADRLTPDGVACGLAAYIDRALIGEEQREYEAAVAGANGACRARFGVRFDSLSAADARLFWRDMVCGDVAAAVPLASWLDQQVNPLLIQACFSERIYNGFDNRVFWKVFGHAGEVCA